MLPSCHSTPVQIIGHWTVQYTMTRLSCGMQQSQKNRQPDECMWYYNWPVIGTFSSIYNTAEFLEEVEMQLLFHLPKKGEGNHPSMKEITLILDVKQWFCLCPLSLGFHLVLRQTGFHDSRKCGIIMMKTS